jgi:EpsI family protein
MKLSTVGRRLIAVDLLLAVGLSSIFLLPYTPDSSPSGISMKLPIWVGNWLGEDSQVTQKELDVLAADTQFARKIYTSPAGDKIFVSIVLSGEDMANSIHRPERCLPAQGWNLLHTSKHTVPLGSGESLPTTRLAGERVLPVGENNHVMIHNLTYYWFVGYQKITPSHFTRTMIDIQDRLMHGYNQHWAYVTVAATVTKGVARPERSEAETAAIIEKFISQLTPKLERPDGTSLVAMLKK